MSKQINRGEGKAHPHSGMPNNKCRRNDGVRIPFSSVQLISRVRLFATPWTAACQASLSNTNSQSPPKPMSIESVLPSNRLILCHPLFLMSSIFPSIRVFSNESALRIRWLQLQHQSYQWTPRADLLQNGLVGSPCSPRDSQESSPTPQFKRLSSLPSAFFIVQLSHPYMTTGKTIALTRQTFRAKWCLWFLICCLGWS